MSYMKKTLLTFFFSIFIAANLLAGPQTRNVEVDFSLLGVEGAFDGQFIFWGTYVLYENDVQIDQGFFSDLARPLGSDNNFCDGNQFNNRQVAVLYGENGIVEAILHGRTALGKNNTLKFKRGSGVYARYDFSDDAVIVADCNAPSNQYILTGTVTLKPRCTCVD